MNNFEFYNPTRIIFGKGTESRVGSEVKKYGSNILFVHYGNGVIEKLGLYDRIVDSLKKAGVSYHRAEGREAESAPEPRPRGNPDLQGEEDRLRARGRRRKRDRHGKVDRRRRSLRGGRVGLLRREGRPAEGAAHRRRAHHPRSGQRGEPGQRPHQRGHHVQDPLERRQPAREVRHPEPRGHADPPRAIRRPAGEPTSCLTSSSAT